MALVNHSPASGALAALAGDDRLIRERFE